MRFALPALALALLFAAPACGGGGGSGDTDARRGPDPGGADAGTEAPDAASPDAEVPDAAPTIPPTTALDLSSGGGRVRSARFVLDVELGQGMSQAPIRAGEELGGANAVEP